MKTKPDSTLRFSNRVPDYQRARPSYPDDAKGPAALSALRRLFHDHSVDGTVGMIYDAQVYYGRLHGR